MASVILIRRSTGVEIQVEDNEIKLSGVGNEDNSRLADLVLTFIDACEYADSEEVKGYRGDSGSARTKAIDDISEKAASRASRRAYLLAKGRRK